MVHQRQTGEREKLPFPVCHIEIAFNDKGDFYSDKTKSSLLGTGEFLLPYRLAIETRSSGTSTEPMCCSGLKLLQEVATSEKITAD